MKHSLVAYFSATGTTARVASTLAQAIGADIFVIEPQIPYSIQDLNWHDQQSRSSLEMHTPTSRPAIAKICENMDQYDTLFVGFPIWWYVAPHIINTFLESYDMQGKTIVPFATSGGSSIGQAYQHLQASCPNARLLQGAILNTHASQQDLKNWVNNLSL